MKCEKCGQTMEFDDGCSMGAYGVGYENCREPADVCKCGHRVECNEPEPPTIHNSDYAKCSDDNHDVDFSWKFGRCKKCGNYVLLA